MRQLPVLPGRGLRILKERTMEDEKMAKALAMLVLENDSVWDDLVQMERQRDEAQSRADAYCIAVAEARADAAKEAEAEVSALQDKLNTAKGDYQRVQADLVEVDLVLVDVGLDTYASRREAIEVSAAMTAQLQERVGMLLAEGDRAKANLAAMQRDRDSLAAEVRTLREFINDKVGKVRNAPERPEGAPELDVPHAGPWMAAAEVVGQGGEE